MRSQWCREHIDEAAENCGLEASTISDVKQAAKFCAAASEFSECSTNAIITLIRIRDDPVRDKAILSVSNALKSGKHPLTGQFLKDKRLPEKTIKKVIRQVEQEVRGELTEKYKADIASAGFPENVPPAEVTIPLKGDPDAPPQPSLAAQLAGVSVPEVTTPGPVPMTFAEKQAILVKEPGEVTDPAAALKERRIILAGQLLACYSDRVQLMVKDLMRENPSWKTVADVFYFGVECLNSRGGRK